MTAKRADMWTQPATVVTGRTLPELARIANEGHDAAHDAAHAWMSHVIQVGEAILEAQQLVERDGWTAWCDTNLKFASVTAARCARIAFFKDDIKGAASMQEALKVLQHRGLRLPTRATGRFAGGSWTPTAEQERRAKALRAQGDSWVTIGRKLNVRRVIAHCWGDADYRKVYAEQIRRGSHRNHERRRLLSEGKERVERDNLAKETGGDASVAYSKLRQARQAVRMAAGVEENDQVRVLLRSAEYFFSRAEEDLVRAMRGGRTDREKRSKEMAVGVRVARHQQERARVST